MRTGFSLISPLFSLYFSACDSGLAGVHQRTESRFRRYPFAIFCTFRVRHDIPRVSCARSRCSALEYVYP